MDIKLYYETTGEGEPLVLLHGNNENGGYFKNQVEYFKNYYKVIALDTRGHGKSPRGTKPFTIKQFADDLKDFFEENKIKKANILGFSDGANIAMEFAIAYPEMVNKLVLNGGNLYSRGVRFKYQLPIEFEYRRCKLLKKTKETEMLSLMVNSPNIKESRLQKITAKTLVIAGNDDMIKVSHTKHIAENINNSKLVIMDGNHFIANKKSDEFNKEVECFLKGE